MKIQHLNEKSFEVVTTSFDHAQRWLVDTREAKTRAALVTMGWTPPTFDKTTLDAAGWFFEYEPHTKYVSSSNPNGGRKSVCVVMEDDEIGHAIAAFLNARIQK